MATISQLVQRAGVLVSLAGVACASAPPPARPARQAQAHAHGQAASAPTPLTYQQTICAIAADIEAIKPQYRQLAEFRWREHCRADELTISYGYHTFSPRGRPGWAGSVPNPHDNGVWFYIDFHDPDSTRQIHTQPVVAPLFFRDKRVMLLLLDGKKTQGLGGAIFEILRRHGVVDRTGR